MNKISYKGGTVVMKLKLESVLALLTVAAEKCKPKWSLLQTLKRGRQNYYFIPVGHCLCSLLLLCHHVGLTPIIGLIGFSLMLLLANDSALLWGWQK